MWDQRLIVAQMQPEKPNESHQRIVVVMPAYNAARTLKLTYDDLPHEIIDNIILVDDGSKDATVGIARSLNLRIFIHDRNRGYGANQKTCYGGGVKRQRHDRGDGSPGLPV